MLGLNGAYTIASRGYQCVGINPANLYYSSKFSINLLTLNLGVGNNTLSLNSFNELNGVNLEDPNAEYYYPKEELDYIFKDDGIIFYTDIIFPLPVLNFSYKQYALNTTPKIYTKFGIPQGFVDLLFYGNEIGRDLSIELPLEVMTVQETAFSYAFAKDEFTFGLTAKYILGYFYSTFEAVDTSYFRTDSTAFTGQGSFLMKQAIGGNGFGLDVGILSREFENGVQFGASVTNLFGSISWSQDHFLRTSLEETIKGAVPTEYYLRPNEFYYYNLQIDSLNATNLSSKPMNEMVFRNGYKVILVEDVTPFGFETTDSLVVTLPDSLSYLIPSSEITDATLDTLSSNTMTTNYPSIFRIGISRKYDESVRIMADLSTGFSTDLGGYDKWRVAFATEITHYPIVTLRAGVAFGGIYGQSLSLGTGFNIGPANLDVGIAYRNGLSINSMKGVDFSITLSLNRF